MSILILSTAAQNPEADLFKAMFASQGISATIIHDLPTAMKEARGHLNPACGTIVITPDGRKLFSMFDICEWIDFKGLRLL